MTDKLALSDAIMNALCLITPRLIEETDPMERTSYSMVNEPIILGTNREILIDKLVTLLTA